MFNKLVEDAIIPQYQTQGAAGMDLHSITGGILLPNTRELIGTGLTFKGIPGIEGQIRSRSGLAHKLGVIVLNSPGTIDEDYTGEIKVLLYNSGSAPFHYQKGDRIAQIVLNNYFRLNETSTNNIRNDNGFGSTGQ
jgi:dUTP pyrophosphatase